jgi:hypothetical protein
MVLASVAMPGTAPSDLSGRVSSRIADQRNDAASGFYAAERLLERFHRPQPPGPGQ